MFKILCIFYIFIGVAYILSNAMMLPKYKNFMKRKNEYKQLMDLINNNEKRPILLNGDKTYFKKDFCEIFCEVNNITFREYNFDKFILELPYKKYKNNIIYVSDFLIDNGRVFNDYEEYIVSNLVQSKNLIIFESEIYSQELLNKNKILLSTMKKIEFPKITKKDIEDYIYHTISFYKYNFSLFLLNWHSYDINKLDFENINLLIHVLNNMFNEHYSLRKIHINVNNIIESIIENKKTDYLYSKLEL
jgi:hypothetical protein